MGFYNRTGTAVVEYIVMLMLLVAGMAAMQPFIARAFNGSWKKSGDSFGYGRQYEAGKSMECAYSQISPTFGVWYDNNCYQHTVTVCAPGDQGCENTKKQECIESYCCENNTLPNTNCG